MTSQKDSRQLSRQGDRSPSSASTSKRICFVVPTHPSYLMGGAQYQVDLLIDGMLARGFDDMHYLARRFDAEFQPDGYSLHRIRSLPFVGHFGRFAGVPSLAAQLSRIRPDIIYQRVASAYTGCCAWHAKRTGAKFIWHIALMSDCEKRLQPGARLRRPHKRLERSMTEYGVRHADTIVAQSEEQSAILYENYGRYADHVIHNFHELPTEPIEKTAGRKRVLWIANFKPSKRPELFIDLARSMSDHGNIEFCMIGAPSEDTTHMRMLESRMSDIRNFKWLGRISQEEVNIELAKSHLLVNTSVEEGFSNTFIQAWMRGTPVATLNIDPDGLIRTYGAGAVAESADSLREIVDRLTTNDRLLLETSRNASQLGREHFSMSQRDALVNLFEDATDDVSDYQAIPS